MLFVAKETSSCKQQQQQRRDSCIKDVGNVEGVARERYCEQKNFACDTVVFHSFPKHTALTPSIKNIFFPFLPEDSGSAIFILSLLSVVDSMLGITDGTGETRKQNQQVRVKNILNDSISP